MVKGKKDLIYILLFMISFTLTYFIKNYAIKKSFVAEVNERSSHTVPTPHGGGIAIVITWFLGLVYLYLNNQIDSPLFYALLSGFVISIVGFFDDMFELQASTRMGIYAAVSIIGLYFIGGLNSLDVGIYNITNPVATNLFALLMVLWYINLTNFIDGINGYVGSEVIFLSLAGFILFGGSHFIVLAVAVLGFLCWNFGNAKIFMGDVGSTLLGYNVAIFTIYYANQKPSNLWIWIVFFGVFWFDATLTLVRRKLGGEKLSVAHKKHAYQRLSQSGWSHKKVTIFAMMVNVVLFLLVYFISSVFIVFLISLIVLYLITKFVDSKKKFI